MDNKLKCIPFIIENDNITECGYANGYVAVPKTHPLYEREYFHDVEDLINIHGGLTLSTYFSKFPKYKITLLSNDVIPEDSWVFGLIQNIVMIINLIGMLQHVLQKR